MKISALALWISALAYASTSLAHVGLANNTCPFRGGQATFAVANTTSEIVFLWGTAVTKRRNQRHRANWIPPKSTSPVPAAIVTATGAASVRPSHQGEFGNVTAK